MLTWHDDTWLRWMDYDQSPHRWGPWLHSPELRRFLEENRVTQALLERYQGYVEQAKKLERKPLFGFGKRVYPEVAYRELVTEAGLPLFPMANFETWLAQKARAKQKNNPARKQKMAKRARSRRENPAISPILSARGYGGRVIWPKYTPGGGVNSGSEVPFAPSNTMQNNLSNLIENPNAYKKGKGKYRQTAKNVQSRQEYYNTAGNFATAAVRDGDLSYLDDLADMGPAPTRKYEQVSNPYSGGYFENPAEGNRLPEDKETRLRMKADILGRLKAKYGKKAIPKEAWKAERDRLGLSFPAFRLLLRTC